MLPWNYGFEWNAGHIVFLGAFYGVLVVVATTVISAALRCRRAIAAERVEQIAWHSDFHDLAACDRVCRHALTGELKGRECHNSFDCGHCETHAKLLESRPPVGAAGCEEEIFGMEFPLDRLYHRGHTWAHPETDDTVTVGLDELGSRLLGVPDAVDLPRPGMRLRANGTAFRVHKRDADVRLLSPVDGEVVETGGPSRGWYLRVKPDGDSSLGHLLSGAEVKPWMMREIERLQQALSEEGATPTLADGGVLVADIGAGYPQADWDAVCGKMFLEP
jgi:glycine cleavage system H lipoate-binding protein